MTSSQTLWNSPKVELSMNAFVRGFLLSCNHNKWKFLGTMLIRVCLIVSWIFFYLVNKELIHFEPYKNNLTRAWHKGLQGLKNDKNPTEQRFFRRQPQLIFTTARSRKLFFWRKSWQMTRNCRTFVIVEKCINLFSFQR